MRRLRLAALPLLLAACGDSGGCGGGDYPYPRTDPEATPTPKAMRARITQSGFDNIARATPGLLASNCVGAPADGTAPCAMDPIYPERIRFYLGTVSQPMTFNVSGVGPGGMRPGSFYSIYNDTLSGNMHIDLVQDGQGGGIRVTVGCESLGNCAPSRHVLMSIDAVIHFDDVFIYGREACFLQDSSPPQPGFTIEQFQFLMRPKIELGADGKPYLVIADEDITIESAEMNPQIVMGTEANDPYCQAGECNATFCGGANVATSVVEAMLETGIIAEYLAQQIARAALDQFADSALEAVGAIDMASIIPIGSIYTNPTGYLIGANTDSPQVSGATGSLGQNYDFDTGFAAARSPCAPRITPPSWALPALPDPGAMVYAPHPVTGEMGWEPFDLALLVGDAVLGRAAFEIFDGGGLCLDLGSDTLAELSGGAFIPTVGVFDLLAPGMASLAPNRAPVDMRVMPRRPPVVQFGTGMGEGETRDSHIQVVWPEVWVEMYPLVDNSSLQAITFEFTFNAGISLEAAPGGNLLLTVDHLELTDLGEVWNEMNLRFDPEGIGTLASIFLPSLVSSEPIDLGLTADTLGVPFVPKFRGVDTYDVDPNDTRNDPRRFLAMLLRFCVAEDLADPANPLCYEAPGSGSGNSAPEGGLGLEWVSSPEGPRFAAFSDLGGAGELQLAFRVDNIGPYFSFRSAGDDGLFALEHPLLTVPGPHTVTAIARRRGSPYVWSTPASVQVRIDRVPPRVQAWREGEVVFVSASDDQTPANRLLVRASAGGHELGWEARQSFPAARDAHVTVWAMDESGLVSSPRHLAPELDAAPAHTDRPHGGCNGAGASCFAAALALLALARRRRG